MDWLRYNIYHTDLLNGSRTWGFASFHLHSFARILLIFSRFNHDDAKHRCRGPKHEQGRDGVKPAHANTVDGRKTHSRAHGRDCIAEEVISSLFKSVTFISDCGWRELTDHLCASSLEDIETVRVDAWEANGLSETLHEHANHRQRDATLLLLNCPPINQDRARDDDAHGHERAAQTIFGKAVASTLDPELHCMVCIPATEVRTGEEPDSWCKKEKTRLQRGRQVEARVDDVSDGC